jgi:hypothetical protein
MSNDIFDVVEYLQESIADNEQYLIKLKCKYDSVISALLDSWPRKRDGFVVQSVGTKSFVGNINSVGEMALRFDAIDSRVFSSEARARLVQEDFAAAGIVTRVVHQLQAIGEEIDRVKEQIPEAKKALQRAVAMQEA